jgi:H+/gluconate symporter-like permease
MVSLPGTPAIQNAIPSQYFGTNTFAAPGIGLICSAIMVIIGIGWLKHRLAAAKKKKEGYGKHQDNIIEVADDKLPNFWLAVTPIVIVILFNYICVKFVIPNIDTSYLSQEKYGAVEVKTVASNWAIIVSVFFSIVFLLIAHYKKLDITKCLNSGAVDSLVPIFNTASVVGYGAVINNLAGFAIIRDGMLALASGNPIISGAFVTGVLGGITGSASGGMSIALEMMGSKWMAMATAAGVDPEIMHRVVSLASASLNALPHNGAIITLFAICGLTHKDSYGDIFVTALIGPLLATITAIALYTAVGSF